MLAAMSSLASLAHHHATAPAFNGLFYATAATLIPVLFLALAVQGGMYEYLLRRADNATSYQQKTIGAPFIQQLAGGAAGIAGGMAQAIAYAILVFGVGGEITAIRALSIQKAGSQGHAFVYLAAIILTVAIAVNPGLALLASIWRATIGSWWRSTRAMIKAAAGAPQAQRHDTGTADADGAPAPQPSAQDKPAPPEAG